MTDVNINAIILQSEQEREEDQKIINFIELEASAISTIAEAETYMSNPLTATDTKNKLRNLIAKLGLSLDGKDTDNIKSYSKQIRELIAVQPVDFSDFFEQLFGNNYGQKGQQDNKTKPPQGTPAPSSSTNNSAKISTSTSRQSPNPNTHTQTIKVDGDNIEHSKDGGRDLKYNLQAIRNILTDRFSEDDLQVLCFDLEVDYEGIAGASKQAKVVNLIMYFKRRDRIEELVMHGKKQRSDIPWDKLTL